MKNSCWQILYASKSARKSCDPFMKPKTESKLFHGNKPLLLILTRSTQTCPGLWFTGHPGEWQKKNLTTTLRFLSAENLILHQSGFWFMDSQVSEEVSNLASMQGLLSEEWPHDSCQSQQMSGPHYTKTRKMVTSKINPYRMLENTVCIKPVSYTHLTLPTKRIV